MRWIKKENLWQVDNGRIVSDVPSFRSVLSPIPRGALVPPRDFRGLLPGTYYPPGGVLHIPPRERLGRFWRFDIANNEKQMTALSLDSTPLRPEKPQKTKARKSRPTRVTVELPSDDPIDYIFTPHDGSALQISSGGRVVTPTRVVIENYYERAKGDKIINRFVYASDSVYHDSNALTQRYDQLYALDTNTVKHPSGHLVSVGAILRADIQLLESGIFYFQAQQFGIIRGVDLGDKPEIEAWKTLVGVLLPQLESGQARRIGIVVDSELDRIESLNLRTAPLEGDLYLPTGIELIYATDAAGSDQFSVNKLIHMCHNMAQEEARKLRKTKIEDLKKAAAGMSQESEESIPGP